jgi:LysR family cyn operon transcriptional activator
VHFVEDGGLRLPTRLQHGDVHLALIVPDDRFRYTPLYPVHNLAVVSTKSRFRHRRVLDVADLAEEPLLVLHRTFGSREWFESACSVANIRPRVLVESAAPHTVVALAEAGYGVGVVPSTVLLPRAVRAMALVQRGAPTGRWLTVAWDSRRSLPAYAAQFADELALFSRQHYPGRELIRRTPPLPRPAASG